MMAKAPPPQVKFSKLRGYKAPSLSAVVVGYKEMDACFAMLAQRGCKAAANAGVRAANTVLRKEIRRGVGTVSWRTRTQGKSRSKKQKNTQSAVKRAMKSLVRSKVKRMRGTIYMGMTGFGVGIKTLRKSKAGAKTYREKTLVPPHRKGPKGLGASNAIWFILGTKERFNRKPVRRTGRMLAGTGRGIFKGIIPAAATRAAHPSRVAAAKTMKLVMYQQAMTYRGRKLFP